MYWFKESAKSLLITKGHNGYKTHMKGQNTTFHIHKATLLPLIIRRIQNIMGWGGGGASITYSILIIMVYYYSNLII